MNDRKGSGFIVSIDTENYVGASETAWQLDEGIRGVTSTHWAKERRSQNNTAVSDSGGLAIFYEKKQKQQCWGDIGSNSFQRFYT